MKILAKKLVCNALNWCLQDDYVAALTLDHASDRQLRVNRQ